MPLNLNNNEVTGVDLNNTEVSEVRLNGQTVFTAGADLIHEYLHDGSGSTISDSAGSDDLSISGTFSRITDGVNFDGGFAEGTEDYAGKYTELTISAKIRINSSGTNDIFFGVTRNSGGRYGFVLSDNGGNYEVFATDSNGNQEAIVSNTSIKTGTTFRATLIWDNGDFEFIEDSTSIISRTAAQTGFAAGVFDDADFYYLLEGGDPNSSSRRPDVDIFSLEVADKVLTQQEIDQLP